MGVLDVLEPSKRCFGGRDLVLDFNSPQKVGTRTNEFGPRNMSYILARLNHFLTARQKVRLEDASDRIDRGNNFQQLDRWFFVAIDHCGASKSGRSLGDGK